MFGVAAAALPVLANEIRGEFERTFASTIRSVAADDFAGAEAALSLAAENALSSLMPWLGVLCVSLALVSAVQSRFFFGAGAIARGFSVGRAPFSFVDVAKFAVRAAVAFAVATAAFRPELPSLFRTSYASVERSFAFLSALALRLGVHLAAAFALLAVGDYVIERARHLAALRMTRDDVRREEREDEGDPRLREARRRVAAEGHP